jgi:endonuclease I
MIRAKRVLAVLLLCAPAGAQTVRLPSVEATLAAPTAAVSGPSVGALASPEILAPASAPAFSIAAPLSAPADELAAPVAAAAVLDAAPAAASPAAAQSAAPVRDVLRDAFDGSTSLRTRSGAVFVPSTSEAGRQFPRGFVFVLAQPSPAARVRSIPRTQGLEGTALLERVCAIAARGQRQNIYSAASKFLFSVADNHSLNGLHGVTDAYAGVFIPGTSGDKHDYGESEDAVHENWPRPQTMNVEHVFPQSLFNSAIPMRSDLHHLMATLEHPNNVRGNLPFGMVRGIPDYVNDAGAKRGGGVFEPPDFSKGRVARAMLYFYARYRREEFFKAYAARFWNGQLATLLAWNREFPPTVEERRRNDQVATFQGNRNPFVDDPTLADRIGADAWTAPLPRVRDASSRADYERENGRHANNSPKRGKEPQSINRPQRGGYSRR